MCRKDPRLMRASRVISAVVLLLTAGTLSACRVDLYRTAVHVIEESRGHTKTFDFHSVGITNPCRKYGSA